MFGSRTTEESSYEKRPVVARSKVVIHENNCDEETMMAKLCGRMTPVALSLLKFTAETGDHGKKTHVEKMSGSVSHDSVGERWISARRNETRNGETTWH